MGGLKMKQTTSLRRCQNCGKPITDKESASIFIAGEKCGEFCSGECISKKLKKNLRKMQRGKVWRGNVRCAVNAERRGVL